MVGILPFSHYSGRLSPLNPGGSNQKSQTTRSPEGEWDYKGGGVHPYVVYPEMPWRTSTDKRVVPKKKPVLLPENMRVFFYFVVETRVTIYVVLRVVEGLSNPSRSLYQSFFLLLVDRTFRQDFPYLFSPVGRQRQGSGEFCAK